MTSPRPPHRGRLVAATGAISVIFALLVGAAPAHSTPLQPVPPSRATDAGFSTAQPQAAATKAARQEALKQNAAKKKATKKKKKAAAKKKSPTSPQKALAAPAPSSDISTTLPRTQRGGVTGDFLRRHYDQWAIVEEGNLNIYDSPERGGGLLRSTPTDMKVLSDVVGSNDLLMAWFLSEDHQIPFAVNNRLSAVTLAWTPDAFYLGGLSSTGASVYRVAADGTCATRGCATWVKDFDVFADLGPSTVFGTFLSLTGLAAGSIGSTPVLAVSLSRSGSYHSRPSGATISSVSPSSMRARARDWAPTTTTSTQATAIRRPRPHWRGTLAAPACCRSGWSADSLPTSSPMR